MFRITHRFFFNIYFEPRDIWVGLYFKHLKIWLDLYICIVPMFPVHIIWYYKLG